MKDVNTEALKHLDANLYEGFCVGLADGKVVVKSPSIKKVMATLNMTYSDKKTAIMTFPKKNKILVL